MKLETVSNFWIVKHSNVQTGGYQTREEIDLPIELLETIKSKKVFLWDDSGNDDPDRILIFSTSENINILNEADEWFIDGTFEISPELFKQVVTINIIFRGKNLPLVYSLVANKAEKTYAKFFNMLIENDEIPTVEPKRIVIDFEKSIINAIKKTMPKSTISCCYFHFSQSMWRNVQNKGLVGLFDENKSARQTIRRIMVIPFIPKKETIKVFQQILNSAPSELSEFLIYFETY